MMGWDEAATLWLNHLIGRDPQVFFTALFLSDWFPWALSGATLAALWFAQGERQAREMGEQDPVFRNRMTVVSILLGAVVAFLMARSLAHFLNRPRPLVVLPLQVPIEPSIWQTIVNILGKDGAFPSDHTAFWGALTTGVFLLSRRWGGVAFIATAFFATLRVALGYHYPTDMIAGFALGMLGLALVYSLRQRIAWLVNPLLLLFDSRPYLAYSLALLVLLDIAQRMAWLFGILANLFGIRVPH